MNYRQYIDRIIELRRLSFYIKKQNITKSHYYPSETYLVLSDIDRRISDYKFLYKKSKKHFENPHHKFDLYNDDGLA